MNSLESFVKFIPTTNNTANSLNSPQILTDIESKSKKFISSINSSLYETSNEPSLGLYRVQEHVRKNIPILIDKKAEIDSFESSIKGSKFDLEYSIEAVSKLKEADPAFESIKDLLTESLYAARQLNIKKSKFSNTSHHSSPQSSSIKTSPSMITNLNVLKKE